MNRTPVSVWIGRILSALTVLALLADAAVALLAPQKLYPLMQETGFPQNLAFWIGIITLACAALYAIPQTAVIGAILLTGFLGGAICTHFRIGEFGSPPQLICLMLGVMAWGGLYLRDARIRALIPFVQR